MTREAFDKAYDLHIQLSELNNMLDDNEQLRERAASTSCNKLALARDRDLTLELSRNLDTLIKRFKNTLQQSFDAL